MAYFSNGTEGMVLDELCLKYIHGYDATKGKNRSKDNYPCTVWMLQMMWNYEQHETEDRGTIEINKGNVTLHQPIGALTERAIIKRQALDVLLPQDDKVLCSMFVACEESER